MNIGRTIFAQLMDLLPLTEFRRCVERYDGDYKVQHFSCLDQFLCLAFAQLTYRESLRDIETCLRARDNFTTWDFAVASRATIWPTPTCSATGASMPTLLACSWRRRAPSIRTNLSRWHWTTRFTLSIPPPSICACPFFLGRSSGGTRARSKSTPCWICAGSSRPMFM